MNQRSNPCAISGGPRLERTTIQCRSRAVAEGEEHGGLLVFGQRAIFAVFHHADNFRAVSSPELEVAADGLVDRSEDLHRELRLTSATVGAFLSS